MRWLDSIHDSMDMNLSKLQQTMKDREAWRAALHGDQIMQDIEAILRNFVLIPRATGRHLRILNRICM